MSEPKHHEIIKMFTIAPTLMMSERN